MKSEFGDVHFARGGMRNILGSFICDVVIRPLQSLQTSSCRLQAEANGWAALLGAYTQTNQVTAAA